MKLTWILGLVGLGAVAAVVAFLIHMKQQADLVPGLKRDLKEAHAQTDKAVASFKASEALRLKEQKQAIGTAAQAQLECETRLTEARRSAGAIRKLTNVTPKLDKNNCPVRDVLDTRQLRDAIGAR